MRTEMIAAFFIELLKIGLVVLAFYQPGFALALLLAYRAGLIGEEKTNDKE